MSVSTKKTAKAILLISGAENSHVEGATTKALSEYSLLIIDAQKISMAGRLILAFLLEIDPAHADAIGREMASISQECGMDSALELL